MVTADSGSGAAGKPNDIDVSGKMDEKRKQEIIAKLNGKCIKSCEKKCAEKPTKDVSICYLFFSYLYHTFVTYAL